MCLFNIGIPTTQTPENVHLHRPLARQCGSFYFLRPVGAQLYLLSVPTKSEEMLRIRRPTERTRYGMSSVIKHQAILSLRISPCN